MISKKTLYRIFLMLGIISITLTSLFITNLTTLASPGLTCELINTSGDCPTGVCVFSLNQETNSHAGNCSYGSLKVCCSDSSYVLTATVRDTDCLSTEGEVLYLNQTLNSHAEYPRINYKYRVCLNSTYDLISCTNRTNVNQCNLGEVEIISLYQDTNSHVANFSDTNYRTKICCRYGACNDVGLQRPVIDPPTPTTGQPFNITCPANSGAYDCIEAYANGSFNQCTLIVISGNDYIFGCLGMPDGDYTANCRSIPGTPDNCCQSSTTESYSVVPVGGCTKDEDCPEPWQKCNITFNTCYDFRPECTGCKYYDWCREGMNPDDVAAYEQGLITFDQIDPCCQDKNNPGTLKECCKDNITGVAMKNCTNAVLNYLEVNVTYEHCHNEECDMSGNCVDWDYRPHAMIPRC